MNKENKTNHAQLQYIKISHKKMFKC